MKKEKLLITGISGFIGSNLSESLRKKYKIIGIDRNNTTKLHKSIDFYQHDINYEPLYKGKVDYVIHLAAKAGVRDSQDKFSDYVYDNILGTKTILDNCVKYWKPKRILIASSSSVYGDDYNYRYHPKSLYATSKVATEQIAESYYNSGLLDSICCMRIFTVYGPRQRKDLAFRKFIDNILNDKPIVIYGNGEQSRDWTYIDDLCPAIEELLNIKVLPFKIDMGACESTSLNKVISIIGNITGKEIKIKYEDMNRHDVFNTYSHRETIKNPTPIEEGLRKQIEWQKKHST